MRSLERLCSCCSTSIFNMSLTIEAVFGIIFAEFVVYPLQVRAESFSVNLGI